jgi:2,3-bisphosphoglycerate-dependent phosphoglycerate mutase
MENELQITFLRHGRSQADDEGVHEGRYDSPLTDEGRSQVEQRAHAWLDEGRCFDLIISSPLERAFTTARIVARLLEAPIEIDPDWMEMDNGVLAGMEFSIAERLYPRPQFRNPYEKFHGSGESDWDVYTRAARAVETVVRRGPGSYLVVAHGGVLNMALRTIAGSGPPVNMQGLYYAFGDTGCLHARYLPQRHRWVVEEFVNSR